MKTLVDTNTRLVLREMEVYFLLTMARYVSAVTPWYHVAEVLNVQIENLIVQNGDFVVRFFVNTRDMEGRSGSTLNVSIHPHMPEYRTMHLHIQRSVYAATAAMEVGP
jgi:hypothetical protein